MFRCGYAAWKKHFGCSRKTNHTWKKINFKAHASRVRCLPAFAWFSMRLFAFPARLCLNLVIVRFVFRSVPHLMSKRFLFLLRFRLATR